MIQVPQRSGHKEGTRRQRQWLLAILLMADLLAQPLVLPARSQQEPSLGNNAQTTRTQDKQGEEIPTDVQSWFEAATMAYSTGNYAEALRWQEMVVTWLNQHSGHPFFRSKAMLKYGLFLSAVGRTKESLAPTLEALQIRRELAKSNPAFLGDLATALSDLGATYYDLGRPQVALSLTLEALQLLRELAKGNPAFLGDLAIALNNLGNTYSDLGRPQDALAPTLEALQIRRELAKSNPAYLGGLATALNNLGKFYSELARPQDALAPTLEALQIRRELAKSNPAFLGALAMALNNLGAIYSNLGRPQDALNSTLEAVQIQRDLAKSNPAFQGDLAKALNNLGKSYSELGRPKDALAPILEGLQIQRELARSNPAFLGDLAKALNNLSAIYSDLGRPQDALAFTLEALQIRRELAKRNPAYLGDIAKSLTNLGKSYSELGRPQDALAPTLEALQLHRELAKSNPSFLSALAMALYNLGVIYSNLGRPQDALNSTLEAVQIRRELAKSNSAFRGDLATALNNLGATYSNLGRPQDALAFTLEALQIQRELAKSNPIFLGNLAIALINLGVRYSDLGRPQDALAPTIEALQVQRELAKSNPAFQGDLAKSLDILGAMYGILGRHQDALASTLEALDIQRRLAKSNPAFLGALAMALNNLGATYSYLGRHHDALAPTLEALNVTRELVTTNPAFLPAHARTSTNLALANLATGNADAAPHLLRESLTSETTYLRSQLPLLPEARRQAMLDKFGSRWQIPFSVALQGASGAEVALFARLNRHGLLLDIQRQQALLARDGGHRAAFDQLQALDARLAAGTLSVAQQQALLGQREQLEQTLWQQLGVDQRLVSIADVQHVIPAGGALLEVQRYQPYQPVSRQWGAARYLAMLLKPNGSIRAIPLGEATAIDAAVARVITTSNGRFADADDALQAASQVVLRPLLADLAGVEHLFISPDGELNRLPFAALPMPDAPSRLFADSFKLRLLTSGRDLLRLQQPSRPSGPSAMVANPDFGSAAPWQPLPHTAEEAALLAPLLQVQRPLTGADASTPNVLATASPRILHIASHGFFWSPEQAHDIARQRAASCGTPDTTPATPAAMQRSGIVLAGANKPCRTGPDDGYLTAAEVTGMDLDGTELTTLSACQTGLGDVRTGEGVYGLQRALAVAGSRSALLSLWKVDDAATREFMATFYGHLRQGLGRADALAATQDAFRRHPNPDYHHIYYWGAFQLTGDWRPLPRW